MIEANATVPAKKPSPVQLFGAVIAGLVFVNGGLLAITEIRENATAVLVLGIVNVLVGGASVVKDVYVKSLVVPASDVAAYANDERQIVTGPAAPAGAGDVVADILTTDDRPARHAGPVEQGPDVEGDASER